MDTQSLFHLKQVARNPFQQFGVTSGQWQEIFQILDTARRDALLAMSDVQVLRQAFQRKHPEPNPVRRMEPHGGGRCR